MSKLEKLPTACRLALEVKRAWAWRFKHAFTNISSYFPKRGGVGGGGIKSPIYTKMQNLLMVSTILWTASEYCLLCQYLKFDLCHRNLLTCLLQYNMRVKKSIYYLPGYWPVVLSECSNSSISCSRISAWIRVTSKKNWLKQCPTGASNFSTTFK